MSLKKHIENVSKDFFLSTNIPIQAFYLDGNLIHSKGCNQVFSWVFDHHNIFEILKEKIQTRRRKIATTTCLENIYFTACPICPKNLHMGIFILGPYSPCENNKIKAIYKAESLMPHLLSFLDTLCLSCPNRPPKILDNTPYSLHIKKAVDYIDARYMDPITLTSASDYLNISKPYLSSLFKKETNKTFTEFLNHFRVEKSKELLKEGNLSVLDIALRVGYNNQNYYNIIFKKLTNQTPLEFRKNSA